jgi:MFS family permease
LPPRLEPTAGFRFIGLLGNAAMNAPLYIYVSRWFDRRRGTALALLGSGSSVSAAIWAPIFAAAEAQIGWRARFRRGSAVHRQSRQRYPL